MACFEPTLDYCVVKIPRWPFDKFVYAKRILGTQMKATGEVMGIAPTFEAALMKAKAGKEVVDVFYDESEDPPNPEAVAKAAINLYALTGEARYAEALDGAVLWEEGQPDPA